MEIPCRLFKNAQRVDIFYLTRGEEAQNFCVGSKNSPEEIFRVSIKIR
jgi:hypothetical protein